MLGRVRSQATTLICAGVFLVGLAGEATARDTFLLAVSFALTGKDDPKLDTVDRARCVFRIGDETFNLNNVDIDRLFIGYGYRRELDGRQSPYVTVQLHGEAPVYELDSTTGLTEDEARALLQGLGPGAVAEAKSRNPEAFDRHTTHSVADEQTLTLWTGEKDRVVRAWKYIYSHGCTGQRSPF